MSSSSNMAPLLGGFETSMNRSKSHQLRILKAACITAFVFTAALAIMKLSSQSQTPDLPVPSGVIRLSSKTSGTNERELAEDAKAKMRKVTLIEGVASSYLELDIDDLIGESDGNPVDELILKYVTFNPATITEALHSDIFRNLRKIRMERVKILEQGSGSSSWDFHRVNLPMLTSFQVDVDMGMGFHDQYTDYMKNITEEGLIGMLFYDKGAKRQRIPFPTDLGDKLVNDGVDVTLRVDGWTIISFNKSDDDDDLKKVPGWEIILGVEFAEKLLSTFLQRNLTMNHLTMTECVVSMKSFPQSLQYLNLYRVNITDGDILGYFESLESESRLTELFIELRNATLKLPKVPKTVKTLAIGDIADSQYTSGDTVGAERLGLGFPLDIKIIENFETIFPQVRNVGVFQPTNGIQHLLLSHILKTNATWILMEGFERADSKFENLTQVERDMEQVLEHSGVSPGERNFLIYKDMKTFSWFAMDLDKAKILKFRYAILGWNEYISWDIFSANF